MVILRKQKKGHVNHSKTPVFVKEKISYVLKNADNPIFVKQVSKSLNEEILLNRHEMLVEDQKKKVSGTTISYIKPNNIVISSFDFMLFLNVRPIALDT